MASDVLGTIGNISADLTQGRIDDIDREIEKDNEKFERQLENENLSEKDRKLIEDRKAKNDEKLNNKKVKEKEKQWKLDKAIALTQIAIQTALAVVKAGVITPTAILTGIVGALQFTLAATTKMPKFKKGTKNAPKGWAIVDEEGPEIHADKKGNIKSFGNDGGANYRFLEQGDIIMPHNDSESYKKLFRNSTLSGVKDDRKRVLRAQQITANDNKVNEALIASIVSREVAKATNSNLTKTIKDGFKGIKLKLDINDKTDSNIIYSRKDGF